MSHSYWQRGFRALNLKSRIALNRELQERQLPPFRLLKNWYQVWLMVDLAEARGGAPSAHWRCEVASILRPATG